MTKSSEKSPNFCSIDVYLFFLFIIRLKKSANSDNYFDYGMENENVRMFLSNFFGSLLLIFYTNNLRHSHFSLP